MTRGRRGGRKRQEWKAGYLKGVNGREDQRCEKIERGRRGFEKEQEGEQMSIRERDV